MISNEKPDDYSDSRVDLSQAPHLHISYHAHQSHLQESVKYWYESTLYLSARVSSRASNSTGRVVERIAWDFSGVMPACVTIKGGKEEVGERETLEEYDGIARIAVTIRREIAMSGQQLKAGIAVGWMTSGRFRRTRGKAV